MAFALTENHKKYMYYVISNQLEEDFDVDLVSLNYPQNFYRLCISLSKVQITVRLLVLFFSGGGGRGYFTTVYN